MAPLEDAYYYDALAIALLGDRHALRRARADHPDWRTAFEACAAGSLFPFPPSLPEACAAALERAGVRIVLSPNDDFPARLREIPHPPHALYIKGDAGALASLNTNERALAIVGTRRATPAGKEVARRFGCELALAGFAVVSGLAFGIDAAAHEGALEAGRAAAAPIAVLAGGLGRIYPRSHEGLARRIIARGGAIVSEYPLSEAPLPYRFIERNRIVSGLSRGALIIEAPEGSGALSTARFALEQDRDVFVVPGNIGEANHRGSNRLIQQGAALVASVGDILESYGIVKEPAIFDAAAHDDLTEAESLVLRTITEATATGAAPPDIDKISAVAKLEPRIVNQALSFLIVKDIIKEEPEGYGLA